MSSAARSAEAPLFDNVAHALRFAYGKRSAFIDSVRYLTDMLVRRGRGSALSVLSPEERVAQAAMILAFVGRMRPEDRASIEARYTFGQQRAAAQRILTDSVRHALVGITHWRMVYELVARHYGKKVHIGQLANRYGVHRNTVATKRGIIERELGRIEERADGKVILYLQLAGLIA